MTESLNADRPIASREADRPARAALSNDLSDGFVYGVERAWGSGKSPLAVLTLAELKEQDSGPVVVEFRPSLVGSKAGFLHELFGSLANALEKSGHAVADETSGLLRQFADVASGVSTTPHAGFVPDALARPRLDEEWRRGAPDGIRAALQDFEAKPFRPLGRTDRALWHAGRDEGPRCRGAHRLQRIAGFAGQDGDARFDCRGSPGSAVDMKL